jgi:putative protease
MYRGNSMSGKKLHKKRDTRKTGRRPELLAPAESLESVHAALEAGADAVYVGLDRFNARLRAKNFTLQTLSYVVPYAHARNVSVYVALNTLIKQSELRPVIDILHALCGIRVDAVIVQDLGLARLASEYFPSLPLHASTQLTVHNSEGALAAGALGFRRVILARETSMREIAAIKRRAPAQELECFVHGALCYSISGLCLASSFLGGASGNRGRCTHVCRRAFTSSRHDGFYFSAKDLCAVDLLHHLTAAGVCSFKIEGRMKNAEYVYDTVSAYRAALDEPDNARRTRTGPRKSGRSYSTFFLNAVGRPGVINAASPPGAGEPLGAIRASTTTSISLDRDVIVEPGDRIRVHDTDGCANRQFIVQTVRRTPEATILHAAHPHDCAPGDWAFRIGRGRGIPRRWKTTRLPVTPNRPPRRASRTLAAYAAIARAPRPATPPARRLTIRITDPGWLDILQPGRCDLTECAFSLAHMTSICRTPEAFVGREPHTSFVLPPFIGEDDLKSWRWVIRTLSQRGLLRWTCGHFSQARLFSKHHTLCADSAIWTLNTIAQQCVLSHFSRFTYSAEDDLLNIRAAAHPAGRVVLFSHPPLFISRIRPAVQEGEAFSDARGERFFCTRHGDLYYTFAHRPLCLTNKRAAFEAAGIGSFLLDLSWMAPDKSVLDEVLHCYHAEVRMPGSVFANHKRGLK